MNAKDRAETAMKDRIEKLRGKLAEVRTGRANPLVLDPVKVEYYGQLVPLKQVAGISVSEGRTIEIRPFDPTSFEAIDKALQKSDVGVAPQSDNKVIRLHFPPMNEERRKDAAKLVGKIGEECRVAVRGDRRDAMEALKKQAKDEKLPEDQQKGMESSIQKLTDAYIKRIDDVVSEKQKDIATI